MWSHTTIATDFICLSPNSSYGRIWIGLVVDTNMYPAHTKMHYGRHRLCSTGCSARPISAESHYHASTWIAGHTLGIGIGTAITGEDIDTHVKGEFKNWSPGRNDSDNIVPCHIHGVFPHNNYKGIISQWQFKFLRLTLKSLFPPWLHLEILLVISSDHRDGPDLAWGGGLPPPGRGPHIHNIIHLVNVGNQNGRTNYS